MEKNLGIRVDFKEVNQQWSPITNKVGITLGHANESAACQHKDVFSHHSETEIDGLKWSFLGSLSTFVNQDGKQLGVTAA